MARFFSLVFLLFLVFNSTYSAFAQQKGPENSLLPEIDPQDIEIRSQFKARFPGLRRQPILGFDPNPRIYQIDPDRMPFIETQDQVVADLPVSGLSRPEPPVYRSLHYSEDIRAFARAGIGSFTTPEANFWGVQRLKNGGYLGGDMAYSSSSGHLDNQESSFRFFNANGELATRLGPGTRLDVDAGLQSDFNHLFKLNYLGSETPRNSYNGFHLGAQIHQFRNTIEGWTARANVRYFDTKLKSAGSLSSSINETIYNASFFKRWAGRHIDETFNLKLKVKAGVYGSGTNTDPGWTTVGGGAEYHRLFNFTTRLNAGASLYYITNTLEDKFYIAPALSVEHQLSEKLSFEAYISGQPYMKTIEEHHEINRFLQPGNPLVHTYALNAGAKISLKYYRGSTLEGGISYMNASDYPYYYRQPAAIAGQDDGFYRIGYMSATNFKLYAGITHQLLPETLWLSGKVYVQNPKLQNDRRIPFKENLGFTSSLTVQPLHGFEISGWADYVGSRKTYTQNEKLKGFLLVGGRADVSITSQFGAYLKVANILSQDYQIWDGYTERPFQLFGGITIKLN